MPASVSAFAAMRGRPLVGMDGVDGTIEYPLVRADELVGAAWAAMDRQENDEALRLWAALREHSPDLLESHIWPIQILWQAERFDEAEAMATKALRLFPDDVELLVQHAWVANTEPRWDEAAERWARVRARAPERHEGYVWGAHALWQSGQLDAAEAVAAEGVRRFPDNPEALAQHGWVATARQDWPAAARRWTLLYEAHPDRIDAQARLIQALRMTGRIDESEAMASRCIVVNPHETELTIEHIWAAVAREDWPTASARLAAARRNPENAARLTQSLGAFESRIHELGRLAQTLGALQSQMHELASAAPGQAPTPEPEPSSPVLAATPAEDEISLGDLMLSFESLGERCDFGAVQRYFGVEPLGLFRFAWIRVECLVAALNDRLEAIGSVEDTAFSLYGDETILRMKKYDIIFHTFVEGVTKFTPEKQEVFYQQQRRRLQFLKDKLIRDLEDAEKIWVYGTADFASDEEMTRLSKALRAYGPNLLLYVRPERPDRPAGTVEWLGDGLYAGYFSGMADFLGGGQPPFDDWRELCLKTYRHARSASGKDSPKGLI